MSGARSESIETALLGRRAVMTELVKLGACNVIERRDGRRTLVEASNSSKDRTVRIIVKTKRTGDWQTSTREARPESQQAGQTTFWIFVDLPRMGRASFYIAPDDWVHNDIHEATEAYLRRHGGKRARTPDSTHHKIELSRLTQWHNSWPILGLTM
jgi:hypothetical protein